MGQNRYEPPRTRVNLRNTEPGSIPRAVAIGAVIDIGGTILGGIAIGLCYSVLLSIQGYSSAEIERALTHVDRWSLLGLIMTGMGLAMSVLAGYQCAMIANRNNYLAPGILSLVSVTFAAIVTEGQLELRELLFMSALTVAAILGGASLPVRKLDPNGQPPADNG